MIPIPKIKGRIKPSADASTDFLSIERASIQRLEKEVGRLFEKKVGHVETRLIGKGRRRKTFFLSGVAVTEITKVEYQPYTGEFLDSDGFQEIPVGEFQMMENDACALLTKATDGQIRFTYSYGYDESDAPEFLIEALFSQMQFSIARNGKSDVHVQSKFGKDNGAKFLEPGLHPDATSYIEHLRRYFS